MPCRSDHMEPTHREQASREAARLIIYVLEQQCLPVPRWARQAAADCYGGVNGVVDCIVFLCETLTDMSDSDRDEMVYGAPKDPMCRRLADWWESHLEDDRKRELLEIQQNNKAKLREQALSKLTNEERDSLGL